MNEERVGKGVKGGEGAAMFVCGAAKQPKRPKMICFFVNSSMSLLLSSKGLTQYRQPQSNTRGCP